MVSTRIDERDADFIETLAKNRGVKPANIARMALHEFVVSYTGETTLHGLDRKVKTLRTDVDGLKVRADKTDGKIELLARQPGGDKQG